MKFFLYILPVVTLFIYSCFDADNQGQINKSKQNMASNRQILSKKNNLLVITVDTTRADHLGCYGYKKIKTPNIDSLARDGVLFKEAFSVQPVTLPAHSSIFTGNYPYTHGVRDNNIYKLSKDNTTLAEVLRRDSYFTTAFVSSFILNNRFGLNQGFDFYNDRFAKPHRQGRLPVDRTAGEVAFLTGKWLDRFNDRFKKSPFFLWLHFYDPHAKYNPPEPYRSAYGNPYDGEIAYMDDWIGSIIEDLKKRDLFDNTMIVLVGDHGESLGEHGEKTHGMFIYRSTTRVPLIIKFPGQKYAGRKVLSRVSQVDIVPTVFSELNIDNHPKTDGSDLLPLIKGQEHGDRTVYSEVFIPRTFNWSELKGVRRGDYFYIDAPVPELYDISNGKFEKDNLVKIKPDIAARLKHELESRDTELKNIKSRTVDLDDATVKQLRALGYFTGTRDLTGNLKKSKRFDIDPKDMILIFNSQQVAASLMDNGKLEQATEAYELLVKKDSGNPRFLNDLAEIYFKLEEYGKAAKTALAAIDAGGADKNSLLRLGDIYKKAHKYKDAESVYLKILDLSRDNYKALFNLSVVYIKQKRWTDAGMILNKALKISNSPDLYNNMGVVSIKGSGDYKTGIMYIKKAVELAEKKKLYFLSLASAYKNSGNLKMADKYIRKSQSLPNY